DLPVMYALLMLIMLLRFSSSQPSLLMSLLLVSKPSLTSEFLIKGLKSFSFLLNFVPIYNISLK
ncbi:hypothetical protein S245_029423, partial [Arachis hypogaea]